MKRLEWSHLLSAVRIDEARGVFPTSRESAEFRTDFERDYGRVVFSTPVRRLHDKTQVFPLESHDGVRTRLSHSIEVSSVARNLARVAAEWLHASGELSTQQSRDVEVISAACGVIHDIGNPPFGHAGEKSIQEWFTEREAEAPFQLHPDESQDFRLFEGNAQTFRLLTKLQMLAGNVGLNLTCGTLASTLKYTASSTATTPTIHEHKKPGFFRSEADIVKVVRNRTGLGHSRHPITFIVEAADDCVYSFVDIEDAIRKGVASVLELKAQLDVNDPVVADVIRGADKAVPQTGERHHQVLWTQAFRSLAILHAASAAITVFKARYDLIMSGEYHEELLEDQASPARALIATSKAFVRKHVYVWPDVLALEVLGRHVIQSLMTLFWESARDYPFDHDRLRFSSRIYGLISRNHRDTFETALKERARSGLSTHYVRLQLVTDYVSGMTDHFACDLLGRLTRSD